MRARRSHRVHDSPASHRGPGPSSPVIRTQLADGAAVCIRRISPADEALMREGIARLSPRSRYLRFFSGGHAPPDWVIDRLLDADGHRHLAWGALDISADPAGHTGPAVGAVHAFRSDRQPQCAEFSIALLDEWHGRGLGRLLTAALLRESREEGIRTFRADTLSENRRAIAFMSALGARPTGGDGHTRSFALEVDGAIDRLEAACESPGLGAILGCAPVSPATTAPQAAEC